MSGPLWIGHGRAGLPVSPGTPLGGYADRTGTATGVLDDLEVRCVAIGDGTRRLLLVVVDLICVNADLAAAVERAVGAGDVWTLATHTHAGPDANCGPGTRRTPTALVEQVAAAARSAAEQALADSRPLYLRQSTVDISGVGAARDRAGGPPIVPVDVLDIADESGRRHGLVAVVPVHPTVLSADNLLVSADLAGAIRRRLGTAVWSVVATGCAGNISTRATRRAQTPAECQRLGELAAEQILAGLPSAPIIGTDCTVQSARRTLEFPVRKDDPPPATGPVSDRFAHTLAQGRAVARERARQHPDGIARLVVSAARIGPLRIIGLGAEPYLAVRQLAPPGTIVLGYTNDYAGYLPDSAAHVSYESVSSPFPPDTAQIAITEATTLLRAIR